MKSPLRHCAPSALALTSLAGLSLFITVILYLNPDWQPEDGGELKLWATSGEKAGACELIEPRMGTMVCFLAGDFWHEVMPAHKNRISITGWFRRN